VVRMLADTCEAERAEGAARTAELRGCLADAVADIELLWARLAGATATVAAGRDAAAAAGAVGLATIAEEEW
jgi:hypothetical protein